MKEFSRFIFELGCLKQVKHEGWRLAGVQFPESVAEHSLRAAQIGYILAHLEGYEHPQEVCAMLVFHDIGECRIGDIHKVANKYISADEEGAVKDQVSALGQAGKDIQTLWRQIEEKSTTAGRIAKDADLLEMAFTGKEYTEQGHSAAEDWIRNVGKLLQTPSAKKIHETMSTMTSTAWWEGLKSFEKKK